MSTKDLLFEIGTEEIPSGFIPPALRFMKTFVEGRLSAIKIEGGPVEVFGTPRRLALRVRGLSETLPDTVETRMGPPKNISFDTEGNPTKAGIGFAASAGVDISEVVIQTTPKGEYLSVTRTIPGKPAVDVLPALLEEMVSAMPFPKTMRWSNPGVRFARPVHWLLALFGDTVLPVKFGSIVASDTTYGNRFMSPSPFSLNSPQQYEDLLAEHAVIADIDTRKAMIWKEIEDQAQAIGAVVKDKDLLDEVAGLLEFPHVIVGSFSEDFLALPPEVLVTVMKHHQRYFPLYSNTENNRLVPYFCAVSNVVPTNDSTVRTGYERVLKARLDDARYFFTEDLKTPLETYAQRLENVIFHKDLGTSADKVARFTAVAISLAEKLDPEKKEIVKKVASLCKGDLNSLMVYELPELQGIMGREYALRQGHDRETAIAIHEHYLPASAEDALPSGVVGDIVGIADRIDTICGFFGIGMVPSGTSDPYALRRQAIAIENILLEKGYRISIPWLIGESLTHLKHSLKRPEGEVKQDVLTFFANRFVSILQARGIPGDTIESVIASFDDPLDTFKRAEAIELVRREQWFPAICAASKRVENILKKTEAGNEVNQELFSQDEERDLFRAFQDIENSFIVRAGKGDYASALKLLSSLKDPIDRFFEGVLVMSDDPNVRNNRIALLKSLIQLFDRVAKFSKITPQQ
ncbi:MAG: glycine--tRNA ligase subunit beta [Desulfomonilia bacterium]